MHNNRNNHETVIIPQTIIVPTKSVIVASLVLIVRVYTVVYRYNPRWDYSTIMRITVSPIYKYRCDPSLNFLGFTSSDLQPKSSLFLVLLTYLKTLHGTV